MRCAPAAMIIISRRILFKRSSPRKSIDSLIQSWAPTMEKVRHPESTTNTPTNRNQQKTTTATPNNQQSVLDNWHPTFDNIQLPPTNKPDTRHPSVKRTLNNEYEEPTTRQGWKQEPLHASFVTNLSRQRQTDNAVIILSLIIRPYCFSVYKLMTTSRQDCFYLPIDDRWPTTSIEKYLVEYVEKSPILSSSASNMYPKSHSH